MNQLGMSYTKGRRRSFLLKNVNEQMLILKSYEHTNIRSGNKKITDDSR